LNPIATLINFFTSASKYKEQLKFDYVEDGSGVHCNVYFKGHLLGDDYAESKKKARDVAARSALDRLAAALALVTHESGSHTVASSSSQIVSHTSSIPDLSPIVQTT
jgi:hypothetical protein